MWMATFVLAAATASAPPAIELILDASGSMNAPLDAQASRLQAARAAVNGFVETLPADTTLGLRLYGHQSAREKHDCQDTALVVPFLKASEARPLVGKAVAEVKAQGYTPITRVIELAANDLKALRGVRRMILLVSDGKETCEGDPCAKARALREADADLVVHTVGLGVDKAAAAELQCVARVTGGTYFDAADAGRLSIALREAAVTPPRIVAPEKKTGGGTLHIDPPGSSGHKVFDAGTDAQVGTIDRANPRLKLPAGLYTVTFGTLRWRGVQVVAGETIVLRPAVLEVEKVGSTGIVIVEGETLQEVGRLDAMHRSASLLPGVYHLRFGRAGAEWPFVAVDAGTRRVLRPGVITVRGAPSGVPIQDAAGQRIHTLDRVNHTAPLPPGDYTVVLPSGPRKLTLREGEVIDWSPPARPTAR